MESNHLFRESFLVRYTTALVLTLAALALTWFITPLERNHAFELFLAAVLLSAWFAGIGPALFASAVSILVIDYFLLPPFGSLALSATDFERLLVFGGVAILTGSLNARLRQTQVRLQEAHDSLEVRVLERTDQLSRANANLEEEVAQRLAAEQQILLVSTREQQRLAEDLHDGLCQLLAGLRLICSDLKQNLRAENHSLAGDAERIETRLGEALTQADLLVHGLYPVELEAAGLMAALTELAAKISTLHRVRCELKCPLPVLLGDSTTANHLFRIAQEAVINAIKSGKAGHVVIRLIRRGERGALSIADDGVGLRAQKPRHGLGLNMMRVRARMINAEFRIQSRPRGVTRVVCLFPLAQIGGVKSLWC